MTTLTDRIRAGMDDAERQRCIDELNARIRHTTKWIATLRQARDEAMAERARLQREAFYSGQLIDVTG
jgi:hypothetical protein